MGQKIIFSAGISINLIMAVQRVQAGLLSTGDVVFLQALMMQLMSPLNFLGNFYREYSESLVEISELFDLLEKQPK